MKKLTILFFLILTSIAGFSQSETIVKLKHQEINFELPTTIKGATSTLQFDQAGSFRKGGIYEREILGHGKIGAGDQIIGVTFYDKYSTHEALKEKHAADYKALEAQYNSTFKAIKFAHFTSIDGNHYYMELPDGITLVLGDVQYNAMDNNYVTITYFKDVAMDDLTRYLGSIY